MNMLRGMPDNNEFDCFMQSALSQPRNDVERLLSELELPVSHKIRMKVVTFNKPAEQIFSDVADFASVSMLLGSDSSYRLEKTVGRRFPRLCSVLFYVGKTKVQIPEGNLSVVVSPCTWDEWTVLRRFIAHLYPHVAPVRLSQTELVRSTQSLAARTPFDIRVRAFSAAESTNSSARLVTSSVRKWTDEDISDVLYTLRERKQRLRSIDLDFYHRVGDDINIVPSARCKLRYEGEVETTGLFSLILQTVVGQIATVGAKKIKFYSKRSLRETGFQAKPVAINLGTSVFEDIDAVRAFAKILAKYPHSMHAVEHLNPYAQVEISDHFDGSSFSVYAIPPETIAVVPGLKATCSSFDRLMYYMMSEVREGSISDYAPDAKPLVTYA